LLNDQKHHSNMTLQDNVLKEQNSYFIISSFFSVKHITNIGLTGSGKDNELKEAVLFLKSMSMPDGIACITVANSLGVTGILYSERNSAYPKSRPSLLNSCLT